MTKQFSHDLTVCITGIDALIALMADIKAAGLDARLEVDDAGDDPAFFTITGTRTALAKFITTYYGLLNDTTADDIDLWMTEVK